MTKVAVDNQVIGNLLKENIELKKQVKQQQNIVEDIKLHDLSKEVAIHIDKWLDIPIPSHLSEEQDTQLFAFRMTKFIKQKLSN